MLSVEDAGCVNLDGVSTGSGPDGERPDSWCDVNRLSTARTTGSGHLKTEAAKRLVVLSAEVRHPGNVVGATERSYSGHKASGSVSVPLGEGAGDAAADGVVDAGVLIGGWLALSTEFGEHAATMTASGTASRMRRRDDDTAPYWPRPRASTGFYDGQPKVGRQR